MNADRWSAVNRIFHAALDVDPGRRAAFVLTESGGDSGLAAEVQQLLRADEEAGTYLDAPIDPSAFLALPASVVAVGDVLCRRFRIVRELAEGGMGQVFEAFDTELAVRIALKVIRPELAANPESIARFRQEVRLARTITHPGICRTFDLERDTVGSGEIVFLTMEFLPGETLASRLQRDGALPLDQALLLARQIAGALEAAHALDIVHRDMKPANIMLVPAEQGSRPGRTVITDFGLARLDPLSLDLLAAPDGQSAFSHTNRPIGTLGYMAPEQLEGTPVSPATDVYAFALILFEMATGQRLFQSVNLLTGIAQRLKGAAPSLSQQGSQLPPAWRTAIEAGLRREPADRPRSATDLVEILEGRRSAPALGRSGRTSRRRVVGYAASILVATLSLFYAGLRYSEWKAGSRVAPGALIYLAEVKNQTGERSLDATTELLRASLAQSSQVNLLDRGRVGDIMQQMKKSPDTVIDGPIGREIAMRAGAVRTVFATITGENGSYRLAIDVQQPDNPPTRYRHHWTKSFTWHGTFSPGEGAIPTELLSSVRDASDWIRDQAGESSNDISRLDVPPEEVTTSNWQALEDFSRAENLFAASRLPDAVNALRTAVAHDPSFALAYALLGDILHVQDRSSEGNKAYRSALEQMGQSRLSLRERDRIKGIIAYDTHDYQAAVEAYRESTQYYPADYLGWLRLARPLLLLGRTQESIDAMEAAHKADTTKVGAVTQIIRGYQLIQDQPGAHRWLEVLHRGYPANDYLFALGPQQFLDGEYDSAEKTMRTLAGATVPVYREAGIHLLANLKAEQGDEAQAIELLSGGLAKQNASQLLRFARAQLYCTVRNYTACVEDLRIGLSQQPGPEGRIKATAVLGQALATASGSEARELLAFLSSLEASAPKDEFGVISELARTTLRGEILLASGQTDAALTEFRKASVLDAPINPKEYLARGLVACAKQHRGSATADAYAQEAASLYGAIAFHPEMIWWFSIGYPPGSYAGSIDALLALEAAYPHLHADHDRLTQDLSRLRSRPAPAESAARR